MPIAVLCPGCQARFSVSDKFAGKKGPCPKCKQIITVPAAAPAEIKIHVPEAFASGGKDSTGRPTIKSIARTETKVRPVVIAGIAGATLLVFAVAVMLRFVSGGKAPIIAAGLLLLGPPLSVAGYSFLRDDELEGYTGKSLWLRATICGLVYALLWGGYWMLPPAALTELWQWVYVAPIFVALGALAAFATLDLDFGSAAFHYCFFLLITLLLRWAAGMPFLWQMTV